MTAHADKTWITIGKVGAPYGVKGWLKIHTYTEFSANMLNYSPWHLKDHKNHLQPITIEDGKPYGDSLIVKLAGIDTPEAARQFTHQLVVIERSQLPTLGDNEYYWSDLIGLQVFDLQQHSLGTVIYMLETGSNDVLVIKDSNGQEHAIPYQLDSVIKKIDLNSKTMIVDWELI